MGIGRGRHDDEIHIGSIGKYLGGFIGLDAGEIAFCPIDLMRIQITNGAQGQPGRLLRAETMGAADGGCIPQYSNSQRIAGYPATRELIQQSV